MSAFHTMLRTFAAWLVLAAPALHAQDSSALPPGAIARLGEHPFTHSDRVRFVSFLGDDQRIFSQSDNGVAIWEITPPRLVFEDRKEFHRTLAEARITSDGRAIFWAANGPEIGLVDLAAPKKTRWFVGARSRTFDLALTPNAQFGVSGDHGSVLLWNLETGRIARRFDTGAKSVRAVAITRDGRLVAGGGESATRVWNANDGRMLHEWPGTPNSLCFSADGKMLASSFEINLPAETSRNALALSDLASGKRAWEAPGEFNSVTVSPDGALFAAAGLHRVTLFDAASGREMRRIEYGGNMHVYGIAFSHDGKLFAAGGDGSRIRVWRTEDWSESRAGQGHMAPVESIAFSPDGATIATGGRDRTIRLWSWPAAKERRVIEGVGESWGVPSMVFSDDGTKIAAFAPVSRGDGISVWRSDSGERIASFGGSGGYRAGLAFLPGGRELLVGMTDGSIAQWNLARGELTRRIGLRRGSIYDLFVMPDGKQVAWMGENQGLGIRDLASGEDVRVFKGGSHHVEGNLAVAPDGSWLAVGWHAWDVESGEMLAKDRDGGSEPAAISPDGRLLAWARDDAIHVWEHLTRLEIHAFGPGTGEVHALAFSPDGTTLASAGHDGSVLMWDMTGGPGETPGADPETWWREFGGTDHWRAHVAAWRLARAGDAVIDLLAQRLAPAKPLDEATVAGLRGKFADADFSAREAAAQTLIDHGLPLSPAEWYALRRPDPRAMIGRGDTADDFGPRLLERRKDPLPDSALLPPPVLLPLPERLRSAHAIEALELSASPAVRGVLESLSRGEERDPQTREAKKALERMLRKRGPL